MRKTTAVAAALFCAGIWGTTLAENPAPNPTEVARRQAVEKMKELHERGKAARQKKIAGAVIKKKAASAQPHSAPTPNAAEREFRQMWGLDKTPGH